MMPSGSRQIRGHRPRLSQRGAIDPPSANSNPEADPTLADLATQAEQMETRLLHLKTGIDNLRQFRRISEAPANDLAEAQADLQQLQQAVEDFEITLASHLLNWRQIQEPFWQVVRYGGLGLVGGWVLHWLVRR